MSPKAHLRQIILTSFCLQLAYSNWAYQTGQQTVHQPSFNPFISSLHAPPSAYVPAGGSASSWQFVNPKSGVPTWIITTTEIETRNETVQAEDRDDEDSDSPVGPNLKEDAMDGSSNGDEAEDPDVEFPVRHGKEPAIKARPAFADPDKYEETTTGMPSMEEDAKNQTKTVTVNRTTVVKIEFVNTAFLPLVLRIDSSKKTSQENNGTSDEQNQEQNGDLSNQMYSTGGGYRGEQNKNAEPNQAQQDAGSLAREQRTSQTFQVVQDQAQAQQQVAGAAQPVAGTPVSYEQLVQHLPPVPLPVQPLYHSQYVNYWKRR